MVGFGLQAGLSVAIVAKITARQAPIRRFEGLRGSSGPSDRWIAQRAGERKQVAGMAKDKAKILVVEDNAALSGVVCFNLVRAGFQVTSVNNGRHALETAEKGSFDLVLSDQQMPHDDGNSAVRTPSTAARLSADPVHLADGQVHGDRRGPAAAEPGSFDGVAEAVQPERTDQLH